MARKSIEFIIHGKNFYRDSFRKVSKFLLISLLISVCLLIGIYFSIISRGEEDYYATSGVRPPVLLHARYEPNMSSEPLLESYPQDEDTNSDQGL